MTPGSFACLAGRILANPFPGSRYKQLKDLRGSAPPTRTGQRCFAASFCALLLLSFLLSQSYLWISTWSSPLHSQDALQEMYKQKGVFPGEQIKPARRPWTLLNFLCWATILLSPLFSFVLGVFASGSPLLILTFLGFVGAGKEPAHMLGSLGHPDPGLLSHHGGPGRQQLTQVRELNDPGFGAWWLWRTAPSSHSTVASCTRVTTRREEGLGVGVARPGRAPW